MKAEYRRDLQHSYLVLRPQEKCGDAYPLRMITENQIQGLLSCSCRRMDEEILYYYDVTSKISLAERCLCRKVTGDELVALVQSLIRVLLVMDEYLLNGNSLCLKPEYIYMDVQMKTVDFCYVPGKLWDLEGSFRELLEGILPLLDHQNQEGVMAAYGLYHYAVQETFSVEGLQRQLEQYRRDRETVKEQKRLGVETEIRDISEWQHETREREYEEEDEAYYESREDIREKEQRWKDQRKHEEALDAFFEDDQEEVHSHPVAVTLGTIGFVLYCLSGWYLWRNFSEYLWFWGGAGTVILAVAIFCIWRSRKCGEGNLSNPESEGKQEEEKKKTVRVIQVENAARAGRAAEVKRAAEIKRIPEAGTDNLGLEYNYVTDKQEMECNTQILQMGFGKKTYLLEEKYPNAGRQVRLNNNSIQFIGHLKDMADVILPSNAVSRLHARFRRDENHCYLRDLNSRNGTWVNGQELQGEQEIEIKPGDEIRFADMVYNLRQI